MFELQKSMLKMFENQNVRTRSLHDFESKTIGENLMREYNDLCLENL